MSPKIHDFGYDNVVLNRENDQTLDSFHLHDHENEFILASHQIQGPKLHLKICSIIQPVYYTGNPIPVEVLLTDPATGDVAKSHEPIEVEIVVLVEKFDFEDDQEWTAEYFTGRIVDGKDGRGLLKEINRRVLLKEGIGYVEVCFKHSRIWFGKCKYRFGARVVGQHNGTRMLEAKTEAFWVQDRRGMNKRDKPLLLSAKIWEIKGIGKKGRLAGLLIQRNIVTVKDFLVEYNLYLDRLKQIFTEAKLLRKWKDICEHALSCKIDKNMYLYSSPARQQTSVVFNPVGELLEMILEGDQYVSIEEISEADKVRGRELVALAFQQWENVKPYMREKKRQPAEDVYRPFYSSSYIGESSCSCAAKRRRTSERDPAAERDIPDENFLGGAINDPKIDSLSLVNTPSSGDNFDWMDAIDYIHDQTWFPHSGAEDVLSYANFVGDDVYSLW